MSGVATAIAGAAVVGAIASDQAAQAQGDIAEAQMDQSQRNREQALRYVDPTKNPQEMEQLNRAIALNESDISRRERLLASADPALIEAGTQALSLLRGEEAKTLGPLKNKIARDEAALRSKLQAQLGPGYENTTAGIQALQAFNQQASDSLATAQQNTLGQLLGVTQDTASRYGLDAASDRTANLGRIFGDQGIRQANIAIQSPAQGAGAGAIGDLQRARGLQQTTGQLLNAGMTLYGNGAFSSNPNNIGTSSGGPFSNPGIQQPASNTGSYSAYV